MDNQMLAFVQMEAMPEYKMCLLKRNIVTNDDEIFETVKNKELHIIIIMLYQLEKK